MLAAPSPNGDAVLEEAISTSARMKLVKPNDHVVVVQRIHDDFCVKILSVDALGRGESLGWGWLVKPADSAIHMSVAVYLVLCGVLAYDDMPAYHV